VKKHRNMFWLGVVQVFWFDVSLLLFVPMVLAHVVIGAFDFSIGLVDAAQKREAEEREATP